MRVTQPPTVIFIASESRSGSTLLDFLIGSHSDVVSGGELIDLASNGICAQGGRRAVHLRRLDPGLRTLACCQR